MHRSRTNRRQSRNAFKARSGKTHSINLSSPRRGGIRL